MTTDLFLKATRNKIRFETAKGAVSVEDLWDLPLTSTKGQANLDDIARSLHRSLKADDSVSFVNKTSGADTATREKFDIVKYVIDTRLAENEAAAQKKANADKKQMILGIIAQKQNEKLAASSIEDLTAMVNSL